MVFKRNFPRFRHHSWRLDGDGVGGAVVGGNVEGAMVGDTEGDGDNIVVFEDDGETPVAVVSMSSLS